MMETRLELEHWLANLEEKWARGAFCGPHEMAKMDRQMKELKRRIQA